MPGSGHRCEDLSLHPILLGNQYHARQSAHTPHLRMSFPGSVRSISKMIADIVWKEGIAGNGDSIRCIGGRSRVFEEENLAWGSLYY